MVALPRLASVLLLGPSLFPASKSEPATFTVSPQVIRMDTFYRGVTVHVEGLIANGATALVTVSGSECDEHFNLKGRKGPIWLNSGKVRISGVPSLFLVFSAAPLAGLLTPDSIAGHHLNEASLKDLIKVTPRFTGGDDSMRAGFLALKYESGSYQLHNTGLSLSASGAGGNRFSLAFTWPRRAPPATYEVRVYEIRNGTVAGHSALPLHVVRAGFPAWLARFAETQAPVYGAAAVLIGALAGFGIDSIATRLFGKKRSVAH